MYGQYQYTVSFVLGCEKTECVKNRKYECTLFNADISWNTLKSHLSDKLHAGWGNSKTCRHDGNLVLSNYILLINHVTVCLPYQEQFALTADEDLKVVKPGSGKNSGVLWCKYLCEVLNEKNCVTHQWVEALER